MDKNYKAVSELYHTTQQTEFIMCHLLNKNMPAFLVERGYFFEMNAVNQYAKNDIILVKIFPDRKKEILLNIEYEHGSTQHQWVDDFPDNWTGLNLLVRKNYKENFSLFIKSSPNFENIFAIDCRDNFINKYFGNIQQLEDHSLDFETDDLIYKIRWDDVEKYEYVDEDYMGKSKNREDMRIIMINNDPTWRYFYRFLYNKFLRKIEKKWTIYN